jgi:hypothetical protein
LGSIGSTLSPNGGLAKRHALVDACVLRQTENPFGDDVLQDLIGSPGYALGRAPGPSMLDAPPVIAKLVMLKGAARTKEIHREIG